MKRHEPFFLILMLLACHSASAQTAGSPTDASATPRAATGPAAEADPMPAIQSRWAEIRYATAERDQADAYAALVESIAAAREKAPGDLRLTVWEGIVLASQAGAQGGLGALSLAKRAKADFEAVIAIDGSVLDGSAYTSLGSLYYQVPGWPLGFGDDDKAAELLQQGLAIAPDGIDANYFYGDFLLDQKRHREAVAVLEHAMAAPDRPGRASADAGRREEIRAALERARAKLR